MQKKKCWIVKILLICGTRYANIFWQFLSIVVCYIRFSASFNRLQRSWLPTKTVAMSFSFHLRWKQRHRRHVVRHNQAGNKCASARNLHRRHIWQTSVDLRRVLLQRRNNERLHGIPSGKQEFQARTRQNAGDEHLRSLLTSSSACHENTIQRSKCLPKSGIRCVAANLSDRQRTNKFEKARATGIHRH